jgi:hypothetical protein
VSSVRRNDLLLKSLLEGQFIVWEVLAKDRDSDASQKYDT